MHVLTMTLWLATVNPATLCQEYDCTAYAATARRTYRRHRRHRTPAPVPPKPSPSVPVPASEPKGKVLYTNDESIAEFIFNDITEGGRWPGVWRPNNPTKKIEYLHTPLILMPPLPRPRPPDPPSSRGWWIMAYTCLAAIGACYLAIGTRFRFEGS